MPSEEPTVVSGGAPQPGVPPAPQRTSAQLPRIGPYRIVRVLGQGGMGLVYEAEQLEPLRRTVALKVIRRGMDTREVLARFESERQALAVMDHPNIARALDAGTTEDGLPYFVMELVAGRADHRVLRRPRARHPRSGSSCSSASAGASSTRTRRA